jgi:rod shape-determining protein MreC
MLMTLDHRAHYLEGIRGVVSVLLYPFQFMVDVPVRAGSWAGDTFASRSELLQELEDLRRQQLVLKTELQKLTSIEAENIRLRELLQSSKRVNQQVLIAEILAVDLDPFSRQVVINKGADKNLYRGQPMLDADGVMGQVVHVGPISSTAMLITDANHALPVQVLRNGLRSIAVGTGETNSLELPYLANNADIEVGDLLVTSGLGGRFPPGYPVARVASVEKDLTQSYAKVVALPTGRLDRVREVLLVFSDHGTQVSAPVAAPVAPSTQSVKPALPTAAKAPAATPAAAATPPPAAASAPDEPAATAPAAATPASPTAPDAPEITE